MTSYISTILRRKKKESVNRLIIKSAKTIPTTLILAGATTLAFSTEKALETRCEKEQLKHDSEEERFKALLNFHKIRKNEYKRMWSESDNISQNILRLPLESELPSLEFELKLCKRSPSNDASYCNDLQFKIASVLLQSMRESEAIRGRLLMKELAERGYPDGMCGYGLCLMLGRGGLECNPVSAVGWFRRCIETSDHLQAMYELGVALYIGEGAVENVEQAAYYFRQAAKRGHVAAAYMYGECLLDGLGLSRDRAEALSWLIEAAQSGHHTAQNRSLAILDCLSDSEDDLDELLDELDDDQIDMKEQILLERMKWAKNKVAIERRYSIGGRSSHAELTKRLTKVEESRKK